MGGAVLLLRGILCELRIRHYKFDSLLPITHAQLANSEIARRIAVGACASVGFHLAEGVKKR